MRDYFSECTCTPFYASKRLPITVPLPTQSGLLWELRCGTLKFRPSEHTVQTTWPLHPSCDCYFTRPISRLFHMARCTQSKGYTSTRSPTPKKSAIQGGAPDIFRNGELARIRTALVVPGVHIRMMIYACMIIRVTISELPGISSLNISSINRSVMLTLASYHR